MKRPCHVGKAYWTADATLRPHGRGHNVAQHWQSARLTHRVHTECMLRRMQDVLDRTGNGQYMRQAQTHTRQDTGIPRLSVIDKSGLTV